MTVEEIANLGDWRKAGDVDWCDVGRCPLNAENYAEVVYRDSEATETWYFCKEHFAEYLRIRNNIREKERKQ